MENNIKICGKVYLKVWDKDGDLKVDRYEGENIITNAGKALIASLAGDATAVPFTYLELGTSSTAVAATDTTLTAAITDTGLARVAATVSRTTTSVTNDTLQLVGSWTASGVKVILEIGSFNAASTGTMLNHKVVSSLTTANGDVVQYTVTVQFS